MFLNKSITYLLNRMQCWHLPNFAVLRAGPALALGKLKTRHLPRAANFSPFLGGRQFGKK